MYYYHLTSFQNAKSINKYGFKSGNSGMLGPGIYFAYDPEDTFKKARSNIKDSIIIVKLNVENTIIVENEHRDWNMMIVKNQGYDSVAKTNCKSGPEICIYDPHKIKIVGIVHWNKAIIKFLIVFDNNIDISKFNFLTQNRKVNYENIKNGETIQSGLEIKTFCNHCCDNTKCIHCGQPKCHCGFNHCCDNTKCIYCGQPKCHCGFNHCCDNTKCIYCGQPKCHCGFNHCCDNTKCICCGQPKCHCGFNHCCDNTKYIYCGQPKCNC